MPIEIRRFGVGHRRPDGPAGSVGLTGQVIHADGRGIVSEMAFARNARIEPHSSPNATWFVVIEGGGWVGVDDERIRIAAGEAACWPADVIHSAWTEHSEMRALVVELSGADDRGLLPDRGGEGAREAAPSVETGIGALSDTGRATIRQGPSDGEPQ